MTDTTQPLRIIDLFAGIGGFHIAFHNLGAETVFAAEWNKQARETYEHNFRAISPALFEQGQFVGDITAVDPATIPDFDILCGGFPCQPFSNAGKRGGFNDTRGTLFHNIAAILKEKQPSAFFLENVRGLLSHDAGQTMRVIEDTIAGLGYSLHYQVVRASDFNVPQHRPRLFLVGFHNEKAAGAAERFEFPKPAALTNTLHEVLGGNVTTPAGATRDVGFTLRVGGRNSGVHDRRNWDRYIVDGEEHALTIDQARQMQGFPDWYQFPVSEGQAFKQLGNSVAVPAIQATAERLTAALRP